MTHTNLTGTRSDAFDAIIRENGEPVKVVKEYIGTSLVLRSIDGDKLYTPNQDGSVSALDTQTETDLREGNIPPMEGYTGNIGGGDEGLSAGEIDQIQDQAIPVTEREENLAPEDQMVSTGTKPGEKDSSASTSKTSSSKSSK